MVTSIALDNRNYPAGNDFPEGPPLINITSDDSFAIDRKMHDEKERSRGEVGEGRR